MRTDLRRLFVWMTVFYIAMAYLESAVVVYLRALYYPNGFNFPLVDMDRALVNVEIGREIATLLMLLAPAGLVTRSRLERFAWFCFAFGVWDLFYYVWLKVFLDWPTSVLEPDLLFLVPVPWIGPVWAPCVISIGLIALAIVLLRGRSLMPSYRVDRWSWTLLIGGAIALILSFTLQPLEQAFGADAMTVIGPPLPGDPLTRSIPYGPLTFRSGWFLSGTTIAFLGLCRCYRTVRST